MGGDITHFQLMQNGSKCLADLCGALHCDHMMKTKSAKAKCNPAAVARNRHFCEVASTMIGNFVDPIFCLVYI